MTQESAYLAMKTSTSGLLSKVPRMNYLLFWSSTGARSLAETWSSGFTLSTDGTTVITSQDNVSYTGLWIWMIGIPDTQETKV
jgi:hypothetical protein